ncbi:MAG TPA: hypothetical protein VJP79_04990 [Nitrososphaera sp.]|nr:hypothetical protein [Nitrososphaera sp.]
MDQKTPNGSARHDRAKGGAAETVGTRSRGATRNINKRQQKIKGNRIALPR